MTVLHSGSTGKYADNWSKAFGGKKSANTASKAKTTAKKKSAKKKTTKKKTAKKKSS